MMIPVFENQDNFTMQEFRDNEIDELYDAIMDAIMDSWTHREYMDSDDVENVLRDVFDDVGAVIFS